MLRIGVVAGEASGDILGAGLIEAIRRRHPDAVFEGIAGPLMEAAGCRALFPAEKLAVMGLVEVLGHLPELLRIRRQLVAHFRANPPDVFVGIDAPDFNIGLEGRLKAAGIRTVHYVSPSVWAWRQGRVKKIGQSVDRVLTLFPFEARFYEQHDVPVSFVGHPLADLIPMEPDRANARQALALPAEGRVVALLPGSRRGEVGRLAEPFIEAASLLHARHPDLRFVMPMASEATEALTQGLLDARGDSLPITLIRGRSREAMAAADAVLLASGTAALEAMLLKRPMVVAYKLAPLTFFILKHLGVLRIARYSLPNLLCGEHVVEELIQHEATPQRLAQAVGRLLENRGDRERMLERFAEQHATLRRDASERAADAVLTLAEAGA